MEMSRINAQDNPWRPDAQSHILVQGVGGRGRKRLDEDTFKQLVPGGMDWVDGNIADAFSWQNQQSMVSEYISLGVPMELIYDF